MHLKAIAKLASSFNKLNDIDSSQIFVEKGLNINKNHINLNRLKINFLYRNKYYSDAIPLLLNLDTIDAKETYSKEMLGRVYYNMDSLEKAKITFNKLKKIDRENFKAYTYLGHISLKEKNYRAATMNYMMASFVGKVKRDEEYYGLASVYFETKKTKEAISNFQKAYSENRRNYKALYQAAKLSDDYYKDRKIAYKLYIKYLDNFQDRDEIMTSFIKKRIAETPRDQSQYLDVYKHYVEAKLSTNFKDAFKKSYSKYITTRYHIHSFSCKI